MRLLREILEDTREEVRRPGRRRLPHHASTSCSATRASRASEIEDVVGTLGELPDLWDFVLGSWEDDSVTSRFGEEAEQEQYVRGLKQLTTKPVVGVGRFTSPDTMVRMVRSGVLDLIGAARPSIADPFLPQKIEEGRLEDIRECIGCNICVLGRLHDVPDPLHPEPDHGRGVAPRLASRAHPPAQPRTRRCWSSAAGRPGLEAAQALGKRGYEVILAEATRDAGRPGRPGGAAARAGELDPRRRLPRARSSSGCATSSARRAR